MDLYAGLLVAAGINTQGARNDKKAAQHLTAFAKLKDGNDPGHPSHIAKIGKAADLKALGNIHFGGLAKEFEAAKKLPPHERDIEFQSILSRNRDIFYARRAEFTHAVTSMYDDEKTRQRPHEPPKSPLRLGGTTPTDEILMGFFNGVFKDAKGNPFNFSPTIALSMAGNMKSCKILVRVSIMTSVD
jgi:hypothetical protein